MPLVQAGEIKLNYVEHGSGDKIIVFLHGNLGCVNWMDLVWPQLPQDFHIYAFDWRGCGDSDKPEPAEDYSNYTMAQHAADIIAAIKALGIEKCHLASHSTGAIIGFNMLLMEPDMMDKVFCLDPVGPMGVNLEENLGLFQAMSESRDMSWAVMATAAPTLFKPESLAPGNMPEYADQVSQDQKDLYELLIDKTMVLSDGIWLGTAVNLTKDFKSGELRTRQRDIQHQHLILWGESDYWIPKDDVEEMAREMPNCELRILTGVGHSCNLENPQLFSEHFIPYFS